MISTKGAHQSAKFQTSDYAQVKFDQIYTLRGSLYKISAKKVQRSYVWWYWRVMRNLKKNQFVVSKTKRIWWILIRTLKSVQNLHSDWSLLCKIYKVWPKRVQARVQWRAMQHLKKSWLVVWKRTWGIWKIFIRTLESVKISTFMGSFCPK